MKQIFVALSFLAAGFFMLTGLEAKTHRSCVAEYKVKVLSPGSGSYKVYRFNAQGSCGKRVKKRCYSRAKDNAVKCLKAHVRGVRKNYAPLECQAVKGYSVKNLEKKIKSRVCPHYRGKRKVVVAILGATFGSSKKCQGSYVLKREHIISCK